MYLHNGDYQSKTTFNKNECIFEEVYLYGLQEGSYLKSEIPYFFSASNGHLSISTQIRTLGHYDSSHTLLETIHLTYITECQSLENPQVEKGSDDTSAMKAIYPTSLFLLSLLIIIHVRRQKNAKNRVHR